MLKLSELRFPDQMRVVREAKQGNRQSYRMVIDLAGERLFHRKAYLKGWGTKFMVSICSEMRKIYVHHARLSLGLNRSNEPVSSERLLSEEDRRKEQELLALDCVLGEIEDTPWKKVSELFYFAGCSMQEVSALLDFPISDLESDWPDLQALLELRKQFYLDLRFSPEGEAIEQRRALERIERSRRLPQDSAPPATPSSLTAFFDSRS